MTTASKATPRPTGLTPAASSPPRSVPSPAHLQAPPHASKPFLPRSPHKPSSTGTPHLASTPHLSSGTPHAPTTGTPRANTSTPHAAGTPSLGIGSSPMATRSVTGSEVGMGTPALNALGLGMGNVMGLNLSMNLSPNSNLNNLQILDALVATDQTGEAELQQRIAGVVDLLGRRWGRVGREGVERCARRLGLECLWEGEREGEGRAGLSIAGVGLLVEVEWEGEQVRGCVLSFPGAGEGAERSTGVGAEVLRGDLSGDSGGRMARNGYVGLEKFAANLGRLAGMDVLGREGVSCFEAVEGLKAAMEKVCEWELGRVMEEGEADIDVVEREVLCQRSGKPVMHGNGKIGLRLEYWMDGRLVPPKKRVTYEMDIDEPSQTSAGKSKDNSSKRYSLLIDCEAYSAAIYPSIRISDSWVSDTIEKKVSLDDALFAADPSLIDWQEPPSTFRPNTDPDTEAMTLDSHIALPGKLPDIRFIAHVDPPVVLPLQKAIEIYNIVGNPLTQGSIQMTTYTGLLFPERAGLIPRVASQNQTLRFENTVRAWSPDGTSTAHHKHRYSLLTNQDWARTVSEIPFSHPRQLVMIMPLLRQWAFLGSLLRRTFGLEDSASPPTASSTTKSTSATNGKPLNGLKTNGIPKFSRHRCPPTPPSDTDSEAEPKPETLPPRKIDVSLSIGTDATPSLSLQLPWQGYGKREVTFHIGLNAVIMADEDSETEETAEKLVRALSVAEDLGVLVEWTLL